MLDADVLQKSHNFDIYTNAQFHRHWAVGVCVVVIIRRQHHVHNTIVYHYYYYTLLSCITAQQLHTLHIIMLLLNGLLLKSSSESASSSSVFFTVGIFFSHDVFLWQGFCNLYVRGRDLLVPGSTLRFADTRRASFGRQEASMASSSELGASMPKRFLAGSPYKEITCVTRIPSKGRALKALKTVKKRPSFVDRQLFPFSGDSRGANAAPAIAVLLDEKVMAGTHCGVCLDRHWGATDLRKMYQVPANLHL